MFPPVAYDISSDLGRDIQSQFNCSVSRTTLLNNHVVGTVSRRGKQKSGQVIYEVAWNHSQYGVTQMSHSHIYTGIENYTRLQSQTSRENAKRTSSGSHASRVKDPYDDPGVDALLLKSRRGEPDLAPCSSESDDDDSDEDKMDEAIEKFFSQGTHMDRASAYDRYMEDDDHLYLDDGNETALNVDDIE